MEQMRRTTFVLTVGIFVLMLGAGASARGFFWQKSPAAFVPGDHTFTLRQRFTKRSYTVHLPPRYGNAASLPLVVNFHGGGSNSNGHQEITQMNPAADAAGYIVVYPQGLGPAIKGVTAGSFHVAPGCCGRAGKVKADDVGFVSKILDEMRKKGIRYDAKRVYATGFSNGSMLTFRLACELSSKIAAIAPVSGQGIFPDCKPSRPVPVLYFHGTEDQCVPYEGGTCGGCLATVIPGVDAKWQCPSAPDYAATWAGLNGCSATPQAFSARKGASCIRYASCRDGASVEFCTLQGGGHTWPNGTYGPQCDNPGSKGCADVQSFMGAIHPLDANGMMFEFFGRYALP